MLKRVISAVNGYRTPHRFRVNAKLYPVGNAFSIGLSSHRIKRKIAPTKTHHSSFSTSINEENREETIAFAFDVDGVLLRGPEAIAGARESLQYLRDNNIPFILLTNGGGSLEADKASTCKKSIVRSLLFCKVGDSLSRCTVNFVLLMLALHSLQFFFTPYRANFENYRFWNHPWPNPARAYALS